MNYNELLEKLWKAFEPRIIKLIKEENDPMKKLKSVKENMETFKEGMSILGELFSGKKDKGLDADKLELEE